LESLRQEEKIIGRELSGVAELLGASGTKFKVGDRVFACNACISVMDEDGYFYLINRKRFS